MEIHLVTYGCTANKADSLRMEQILTSLGHIFTDNLLSSDLVIVNTCTVTRTTERKVLKFINSLSKTGKRIVVAGCIPAAQFDLLNEIDCQTVTPSSLDDIVNVVDNNSTANFIRKTSPIVKGVTGICSISTGCVGNCTYCIVKQARGELVSRPLPEIVNEIASLLHQGAKEIQLTSQDTAAYGLDIGVRLPELLNAISRFDGDHMIRIGMMNPFTLLDILDDVIGTFGDPHIFKFLHLPVQSGSNSILAHMNRNYTVEDFENIVTKFRARYPGITISTDFITGYPAETDKDCQDTLRLLHKIKPQKVNITRYSSRPATKAAKEYDMPDWIKKERSRALTKEHHLINNTIFSKRVGENIRILTTEPGINNSTIGRDRNYTNIVVRERLPLGNWYNVRITEARKMYLIGKRIHL
ncbi:MAG: coproporphyrinogen III oxidase [ANME-2 cluster archaeon HR1]|nr:MAG: coproporphyrinogen III oxidase [ANME-2 cluster archaeon HR1]